MARVSQEHLDARRRQILDGAARLFASNGFHATSMQDVLKEVDLSAGAVYRYFSGKDELIAAIVKEVLGEIRVAFADVTRQSPPPPPDLLVGLVLGRTLRVWSSLNAAGESPFPRLIMQVWAETVRNEELAVLLTEVYTELRENWARAVEAYQDAGMLPSNVPADHVARTMIATVQGFIVQQALFGPAPVEVLQDGLRALMSVSATQPDG
ncbi:MULTISPECIES: TetR/AcrR family transcriptional regulator [unclassified Streptomyces]|uniref:TetR/AcrR family transcriptional regulator n=1 Tax=unclassified Streptomyces TaxID=2593676 RepID=UPI0023670449|nr:MULTISPECIES: TetR/AcrR family transcriptional regulator [unclassified Streptomyces]MDF3148649.1 TetR/AcrR family transcriptional regulator [Streptomyces sp. T21Q-yed]WDF36407.1 TetR/AcrR family transcriptional regulator [Streptomyces sp. T12]